MMKPQALKSEALYFKSTSLAPFMFVKSANPQNAKTKNMSQQLAALIFKKIFPSIKLSNESPKNESN